MERFWAVTPVGTVDLDQLLCDSHLVPRPIRWSITWACTQDFSIGAGAALAGVQCFPGSLGIRDASSVSDVTPSPR